MTSLGALGIDFFTPIVNPPRWRSSASVACSRSSRSSAGRSSSGKRCTSASLRPPGARRRAGGAVPEPGEGAAGATGGAAPVALRHHPRSFEGDTSRPTIRHARAASPRHVARHVGGLRGDGAGARGPAARRPDDGVDGRPGRRAPERGAERGADGPANGAAARRAPARRSSTSRRPVPAYEEWDATDRLLRDFVITPRRRFRPAGQSARMLAQQHRPVLSGPGTGLRADAGRARHERGAAPGLGPGSGGRGRQRLAGALRAQYEHPDYAALRATGLERSSPTLLEVVVDPTTGLPLPDAGGGRGQRHRGDLRRLQPAADPSSRPPRTANAELEAEGGRMGGHRR